MSRVHKQNAVPFKLNNGRKTRQKWNTNEFNIIDGLGNGGLNATRNATEVQEGNIEDTSYRSFPLFWKMEPVINKYRILSEKSRCSRVTSILNVYTINSFLTSWVVYQLLAGI